MTGQGHCCFRRHGASPDAFIETNRGFAIIASEVGAPAIPFAIIKRVHQLGAGEMVLIENGKFLYPGEADKAIVGASGFNYKRISGDKNAFSPKCIGLCT